MNFVAASLQVRRRGQISAVVHSDQAESGERKVAGVRQLRRSLLQVSSCSYCRLFYFGHALAVSYRL